MPTLNFRYDLESTTTIPATNAHLAIVLDGLAAMHEAIPLQLFRMRVKQGPPPPPGVIAYDYTIKAQDGSEWAQVITFDTSDPKGAKMTFDVGDYPEDLGWHAVDFALQREPRSNLIRLVELYGLTKFEAKW